MDINPCIIIPIYNHDRNIINIVNTILSYKLTCILIDDGSSESCAKILDQLVVSAPDFVILLRHKTNQGKGAAVMTGFRHASKLGYTHALQIDADGQHCVTDIPKFLDYAKKNSLAVITGCPEYDHTVPKLRLYMRYLTHIWVWINTLSLGIKDSMCGFRVYPLDSVMSLDKAINLGKYMDFDTEIIVRLYWQGLKIINIPTKVIYPENNISHFRIIKDNVLISAMHAKLFFGMLWRLPGLLTQKISR